MSCPYNCSCAADQISFWWMNDNHTFIQLKGRRLEDIISHAEKIRKKSKFGMLCPAKLLYGDKDLKRIGDAVHDNKDWEQNLKAWKHDIENNPQAMELIEKGKIKK